MLVLKTYCKLIPVFLVLFKWWLLFMYCLACLHIVNFKFQCKWSFKGSSLCVRSKLRESILHHIYIVHCICWFSCERTFTFSISRSVLKLNKSHTTMLLQSQQILGSNIWHDLSLVNISSSKKSVVCKQQSTSWDPLHAKINDYLSGYFMMTSSL